MGLFLVFMAGVLWSTVGLGIRLIEDALVWQILLYRSFSLSLLLAAVITLRSRGRFWQTVRATGWAGVIGGLALILAYAGGIYSLQKTSVANALLLFATAPFMAAVLGRIVLGERVRIGTWVAILVAIFGIAVMFADKTGAGALIGSLAAIGSAFGFAVFTVALRWGKTTEMLPAVLLSGIFGVILMGAICLTLGLSLTISANDTAISLSMGLFQVGAGLVLYTLGSKALPAAELTLLSMAEVLLGPVWVWLFLGETATVYTLIGGLILLLAIAGNALTARRRAAK